MSLTREQIEEKNKGVPTMLVDIPEWGDTIRIRRMTGVQRGMWDNRIARGSDENGTLVDQRGLGAFHAALVMIDDDGKPLYDAMKDEHIVNQLDGAVLARITEASTKFSRLTVQALEDAAKNLQGSPS